MTRKKAETVFFQPKTKDVVVSQCLVDYMDALLLVPEGRSDLAKLVEGFAKSANEQATTISIGCDGVDIQLPLNKKADYMLAALFTDYCRKGDLVAVKFFVEVLKTDPNTTIFENTDIQGALCCACYSGQFDIINYLLTCPGSDANVIINRQGITLLHHIILFADNEDKPYYVDVLRLLQSYIKLPAVINKKSSSGQTALYTACNLGKMALAKILIEEFKADINIKKADDFVYSPFLAACRSGNLELTKYFIESKMVNPKEAIESKRGNLKKTIIGSRAFLIACTEGHLNIAQYIKTIVPEINIELEYAHPMQVACRQKHWNIVEYIITQRPIPIQLDDIKLAYSFVLDPECPKTLKNIFLEIPGIKTMKLAYRIGQIAPNQSKTVLNSKIARGGTIEKSIYSSIDKVREQLLAEQLEIKNAKETQQKQRKLNQTIEKDHAKKFADKAIIAEANLPQSAQDVMLKLIDAVRTTNLSKMTQAMRYFQQFNDRQSSASSASSASPINMININEPDDNGDTLLHIACKLSTLEKSIITINNAIIAILIKNGANLYSRNHLGETPFFVACKEGSTDLMTYLLDPSRGYYISTPDHAGQSPLSISKQNKKMDSVRLMLWVAQSKEDALLRANPDDVGDLPMLEEPDIDQDTSGIQWTSVAVSLNKKIALMDVVQLKEYFYIASSAPKKIKEMSRYELNLLENQAIKLLRHADEDPSFDLKIFSSIPNLLLQYEAQHTLSRDFISLWDKTTTAAMLKNITDINLLAKFISVFANSGVKPSHQFKEKWIERVNLATHQSKDLATYQFSTHAIASSIRSCAKLLILVDLDMIVPEGLIDVVNRVLDSSNNHKIVNDQTVEFSLKDIHSLGISNAAYETSGKRTLFDRLDLSVPASETRSSEFQDDVFRIVSNHPTIANNHYQVISEKVIEKIFTPVDVFIDRGPDVKKLIIQADGRSHFNSLGTHNNNTSFLTKLFENLGYEVSRVSLNTWMELKDDRCKIQYIDQLLSIQCRYAENSSSAATPAFVPASDRIQKRTVQLRFMDNQHVACAASVPPSADNTTLDMALAEKFTSLSLMP